MYDTDTLIRDKIQRLKDEGFSESFVDGFLDGVEYTTQYYQSLSALATQKDRLLREEWREDDTVI